MPLLAEIQFRLLEHHTSVPLKVPAVLVSANFVFSQGILVCQYFLTGEEYLVLKIFLTGLVGIYQAAIIFPFGSIRLI